jgi:hypothetical protein
MFFGRWEECKGYSGEWTEAGGREVHVRLCRLAPRLRCRGMLSVSDRIALARPCRSPRCTRN